MRFICEKDHCTGCNACLNICEHHAVAQIHNIRDEEICVIDEERCVNCGLCRQVCPQNTDMTYQEPLSAYAAWSLDAVTRETSASGGIAAELYNWALRQNMWISGVRMNFADGGARVEHYLTKGSEVLVEFQNSKYVYSDTGYVLREIVERLGDNEGILFVGLPCQCDALRRLCHLKRVSTDRLYVVDLVCHGTIPQSYLREHVSSIETRRKRVADQISFRDPDEKTYNYAFTLKEHGNTFYSRRIDRNDYYQIGFHKGISLRENCYSCIYTRKDRAGDLTLADISGLGKGALYDYDFHEVSGVLANTEKGLALIKDLARGNVIYADERPTSEELDNETMFHHPTPRPKEREHFVRLYTEEHAGFEKAMSAACRRIVLKNELTYHSHIQDMRKMASRVVPPGMKAFLKELVQ